MLFNKKASLEISIQAIVIVVLAMTLLGLGLGFVKGLFGNITDISKATFDKIADQLNRDLVNSNEKLVFSQTKITLERGKSILLGWGIKNDGTAKLNYYAEFTAITCPDSNGNPSTCAAGDITNWFTYKPKTASNPTPYSVEAAGQKVERVDLQIPKTNNPGLYLIEVAMKDGPIKYATSDLYVTVT